MQNEFDSEFYGESVTLSSCWTSLTDGRWQATPTQTEDSVITVSGEGARKTKFQFQNNAIVLAEKDRICYNSRDLLN